MNSFDLSILKYISQILFIYLKKKNLFYWNKVCHIYFFLFQERYDLINNEIWSKILDLQVGDTVWYYRSSKAANVAATSKQNGNFGHVQNSSTEKDVGFVRYIGAIENDPKRIGFWVGVELFLEPQKGNQSGRIGDQIYFEAPEYSSVFTKVFLVYFV